LKTCKINIAETLDTPKNIQPGNPCLRSMIFQKKQAVYNGRKILIKIENLITTQEQ